MSVQQCSLFEFMGGNKAKHKPRLEPTIANKVGLKKFACLKGRSGKNYVFSVVKPDSVREYDKALFACSDETGKKIFPLERHNQIPKPPVGARLYMHILRDRATEEKIIDDLF